MLGFRVFILYKSLTNHSSIKCLENEFAEKCTYDTNTSLIHLYFSLFKHLFIITAFVDFQLFTFLHFFISSNFHFEALYISAFYILARHIPALYIFAVYTLLFIFLCRK